MSSTKDRYSTNEYLRMLNMISLLQEIDEGMSVQELSEKYQLPMEVILEDLWYVHKSKYLQYYIEPADLDVETDAFLDTLFAGQQNDTKLVLITEQYKKHSDKISVQLTQYEHIVLNEFLKKYYASYTPIQSEIYSKKVVQSFTFQQLIYMQNIQNAISNRKKLKVTYLTKEKELLQFQCVPIKMVKLISDELLYLIAITEEQQMYYRLDRIKKLDVLSEQYMVSQQIYDEVSEEFEYRWGMGSYEEPFQFTLQVFDEANLPSRLQKELAGRKYGKWSKNEDGSYLYQDYVIDYDALKNWVLSLGSSVKVLEPKRLARDIKASAKRRMELYSQNIEK